MRLGSDTKHMNNAMTLTLSNNERRCRGSENRGKKKVSSRLASDVVGFAILDFILSDRDDHTIQLSLNPPNP